MKPSTLFVASLGIVASATAFVPTNAPAQSSTQLSESIFKKISDLDLWAPVSDSNDYGARGKKAMKTGTLSSRSYVPTGLTKAQYEKIRSDEVAKKKANYDRNVAKAFKFQDFTKWYEKRGTEVGGSYTKAPNLGHTMAKTKYDWSGEAKDEPIWTGITKGIKK